MVRFLLIVFIYFIIKHVSEARKTAQLHLKNSAKATLVKRKPKDRALPAQDWAAGATPPRPELNGQPANVHWKDHNPALPCLSQVQGYEEVQRGAGDHRQCGQVLHRRSAGTRRRIREDKKWVGEVLERRRDCLLWTVAEGLLFEVRSSRRSYRKVKQR